ncbi:sulfite oxidase heme-binding subunit YedZ [Corallincola spongiicola]|uniref:Protein-methionine-sulfoxide reductase heme-binding subunit MsrQ n=1 Tax=Corallincola spongiicola TaxID=2520508 RepID=A0ABY1WNG8_9GAMM|nr:protein-methionine-sulfoxide reductase heme-binding subunit MsrQ [Corallincola spongiicola]TAA45103.1 sulfoxide reductase heme-binding subunit YedZ [Corallincola spongiicola]
MRILSTQPRLLALKSFTHLACLLTAVGAFYLGITDQLGGDPVKAIIHFYGKASLNLLILTLCVTPLSRWRREPLWLRLRRLLGLYAFFFASLHILSFLWFDLQLAFALFISEVIQRPYITLGMAAYLVLLALTITSTKSMQRRLGKRWQLLHNWVYLGLPAIVVHYYWSVKAYIGEPLIYFAIVFILLWLRRDKFKRMWRQRLSSSMK